MPPLPPFVDELPVPDVVHPLHDPHHGSQLGIAARVRKVKLHRDLDAKETWSYCLSHGKVVKKGSGDTFLGPTIEVKRKQTVTVDWKNEIPENAVLPYEVVKVPYNDKAKPPQPIPQNSPGDAGALTDAEDKMRAQLRGLHATLVTHLHGGRTQADSDGWPDNTSISGQSVRFTYHNDQSAAMLWYHDHCMHVTRLNVYAGLAGAWLIRDDIEDGLHLPSGTHELPLVIQDRNLALDAKGNFTGAVLHKTETDTGPAEFFGPYTLVNGKIWPKATVEAGMYRLRLLNGSNARTYRLLFLDEQGNSVGSDAIRQIGCDQGLVNTIPAVPVDGLRLAPAERIDLLIDFKKFAGHSVYLWNTAEAPFQNDDKMLPDAVEVKAELAALLADPHQDPAPKKTVDARRPFPQVMRFDVGSTSTDNRVLPPIDSNVLPTPRPAPVFTDKTPVRIALLVERGVPDAMPGMEKPKDATSMLVFWECVPVTEQPPPPGAFVIKYWHPSKKEIVEGCFIKGAEEFYDKLNWRVHLGDTELWYFINLSGDTHPIHVHLVDMTVSFQLGFLLEKLNGQPDKDLARQLDPNKEGLLRIVSDPSCDQPDIEPIVRGPKDTVRVNPGEMVGLAMTFGPYPGRFMYHCHILEHEDHDMMRPFVVVPKWVPHHSH